MVYEQYCFDVSFLFCFSPGFFIFSTRLLVNVVSLFLVPSFSNAQRASNASSRFTDFVQRQRVACVQCTESQINNKKEYTEIYSSLSLNHHLHHHQQQQHRRHSLLHVWHHRRNINTKTYK